MTGGAYLGMTCDDHLGMTSLRKCHIERSEKSNLIKK